MAGAAAGLVAKRGLPGAERRLRYADLHGGGDAEGVGIEGEAMKLFSQIISNLIGGIAGGIIGALLVRLLMAIG